MASCIDLKTYKHIPEGKQLKLSCLRASEIAYLVKGFLGD